MPIYEEEGRVTRDDLLELCKRNKCAECGGRLDVFLDLDAHKAYLACHLDQSHEGIEREASRYEKEGVAALNIKTREEIMTQEYGEATTKALDKYIGVVSLTKPQAREILVAVYPEAPLEEITRAVMLCASYGLNPLMKHVFLIPFNKGTPKETWATVLGIKAARLLASRRGPYSYVDNTPRVMREDEQMTIFGEVDRNKLWVITRGKDPATGAEAVGYGFWPKGTQPHGTEKGNTGFNMGAVRSERQMLDRLRPGEMPVGIEVVPEEAAESAIEAEYTVKEEQSPEKEHWCEEHNCAFEKKTSRYGNFYSHKLPGGGYCKEGKKKEAPVADAGLEAPEDKAEESPPSTEEPPPPELVGHIAKSWLEESLKTLQDKGLKGWTESNLLGYIKNTYEVEAETVIDAVAKLDQGKAAHFVKKVQETLEMA